MRTSEMSQPITANPHNLSLSLRANMIGRENCPLQVILWPPCGSCDPWAHSHMHACTHACGHTDTHQNKSNKSEEVTLGICIAKVSTDLTSNELNASGDVMINRKW